MTIHTADSTFVSLISLFLSTFSFLFASRIYFIHLGFGSKITFLVTDYAISI